MKKIIISLFIFLALALKSSAAELIDGIKILNTNNNKKACEFFQNYVNNNPNDPDGHYWLGLCLKRLGEEDESCFHLQKSFELSQSIDDIDFVDPIEFASQDDYIDMGLMYLETKSFDMAHAYADMALKLNPNNASGYYLRAKIYGAQDDFENARGAMIRAIQADNALLNTELAQKLDIKEIPPFDFEYFNSKGVEYYYRGDLDNAVVAFKKSLDMNFKNPSALNNLANTYIAQGKLSEAKSTLKKAQITNPKYFQTYLTLARLSRLQCLDENISKLAKIKYENEIKSYLKKALDINPNDKRAYLLLGNYFLEQKEYDNAIKNFNTALVLDEEYYEAYFGLAAVYVETNQTQKALVALRNAGALNENADEILYYLAKMCIIENKFDEAQDYLNEALQKAQKPEYYLELGKIYYYKDDFESAKNAFLSAQSFDVRLKNQAELHNFLGLCYYRTYDIKNALTNLKMAVKEDPQSVIYAYNLALAYKSDNQKDLYNKTYQKVSSFVPKKPQDYIDLSSIYIDKQKTQSALNIIDEGITKYPQERCLYNAKLRIAKAMKNSALEEEINKTVKELFN